MVRADLTGVVFVVAEAVVKVIAIESRASLFGVHFGGVFGDIRSRSVAFAVSSSTATAPSGAAGTGRLGRLGRRRGAPCHGAAVDLAVRRCSVMQRRFELAWRWRYERERDLIARGG